MKTRKIKFTTILAATLFSAALIWLAPVAARAQGVPPIILKPGEIIYGRFITNPNGGGNCATASVWAVGQDGSNDRLLFSNAVHPRISPDGRFIMYKRFPPSAACIPFSAGAEIRLRELATGRETLITSFTQPFGTFFTPETNRADNQIIFDTNGLICRVGLSGGNPVCSALGTPSDGEYHPSVRGGDYLTVASNNGPNNNVGGLYTFNYNLTNAVKIANTTRGDGTPSWSNDGQTIAYAFISPPNSNASFYEDLYKIKPDGSNKTRLTFLNGTISGSPNGFRHSIVWTTNNFGDEFIFNAVNVNNVSGIYKISADGSGNMSRVQITAGNAPDWVGGIVPVIGEKQVAAFGGGASNGGNFTLVDTVGQAFAGQNSTGGNFNLQSGFWTIPAQSKKAPFDFDGDNKTDLAIFRPAPAEWWINRSSNGGTFATQFGQTSDKIVPSDFTGDGKTDIAFWRPSSGFWFILRSEDLTFFSFPFGANGDFPAPADYDGDGKSDAAVFRPSNQTWFISKSSGGTSIVQFGIAGDVPVVADYDGDNKADIAIFRPNGANGAEWWIQRSSTGQVFATQFGLANDKAVFGDYTGDGKSDIAYWRPSNGTWFILRSEDFSFFAFPFGTSTDIPAPGDYDGDGKFDAAIFRPSNSTWFVQRSTAGTLIQQFGIAGDLPLPNVFVP